MLPPEIDKAVDHLIRWSNQDDWAQCQSDIFADHFDPISKMFDLYHHEIIDLIGEASALLFAFIMEDFFTTRFGDRGERNVIDSYLERHGWREDILGKRYLDELKVSTAMLYEICDLDPGRTIAVRDLMLGGDPVTVAEPGHLDFTARGDCLAGRLLEVNGTPYLSSGLLYYPRELTRAACATLEMAAGRFVQKIREEVMGYAEEEGEGADDAALRQAFFSGRVTSQILTEFWMAKALYQVLADTPQPRNADGERIRFSDVSFPVRADEKEVASILDQIDAFERDADDGPFWMWLDSGSPKAQMLKDHSENPNLEPMPSSRESALGIVNLVPDGLVLSANSVERAKRGRDLLIPCLGKRVGRPRITHRDPNQAFTEYLRKLSENPRFAQYGQPEDSAGFLKTR